MIKNLLFCLLIASVTQSLFAQQDILMTHFMFDKLRINPAITGVDEGVSSSMIYRNQWDKVAGAPNTAIFNCEMNLNKNAVGGAGISFYHDAIGPIRQNRLLLNYSYPFQIGEVGVLHAGIGIGLLNFGLDPNWIPPTSTVDASLPTASSGNNMDGNFGLYYKSFKGYYVGLSSAHLNKPTIHASNFTYERHYFLNAGHRLVNILGPKKDIEFQFLLMSDLIKHVGDINVRYTHANIFYAGLTVRTTNTYCMMAGFYPLKNITLGYSFDLNANSILSASNGTHEIVIRYRYIAPIPPSEKSQHPRWL
jgi:type IX secretion system PorP/SprF family membrane protein